MARAVIIAATIAILAMMWRDAPKPVQSVEVPYCMQPVWDRWGREIGGKWVMCSELDRYEEA